MSDILREDVGSFLVYAKVLINVQARNNMGRDDCHFDLIGCCLNSSDPVIHQV